MKKDTTVRTKWIEEIDDVKGDHSPRIQFSKAFSREFLNDSDLLLDVGCGNGTFLYSLDKANSIGIELEIDALKIAKRNCPKNEFVLGSSLNLPFRQKIFGHVTLWEVIEHVPKGTESLLLTEINRVSKENVNFTMSTPNNHPIAMMLDPAYFFRGHRHYSMKALNSLVSKHGFEIKSQRIKGGLGMLLEMNLFYFFKHILKRRPSGTIYGLFFDRSKKEYLRDYNGLSNCFLASVKIRG